MWNKTWVRKNTHCVFAETYCFWMDTCNNRCAKILVLSTLLHHFSLKKDLSLSEVGMGYHSRVMESGNWIKSRFYDPVFSLPLLLHRNLVYSQIQPLTSFSQFKCIQVHSKVCLVCPENILINDKPVLTASLIKKALKSIISCLTEV